MRSCVLLRTQSKQYAPPKKKTHQLRIQLAGRGGRKTQGQLSIARLVTAERARGVAGMPSSPRVKSAVIREEANSYMSVFVATQLPPASRRMGD